MPARAVARVPKVMQQPGKSLWGPAAVRGRAGGGEGSVSSRRFFPGPGRWRQPPISLSRRPGKQDRRLPHPIRSRGRGGGLEGGHGWGGSLAWPPATGEAGPGGRRERRSRRWALLPGWAGKRSRPRWGRHRSQGAPAARREFGRGTFQARFAFPWRTGGAGRPRNRRRSSAATPERAPRIGPARHQPRPGGLRPAWRTEGRTAAQRWMSRRASGPLVPLQPLPRRVAKGPPRVVGEQLVDGAGRGGRGCLCIYPSGAARLDAGRSRRIQAAALLWGGGREGGAARARWRRAAPGEGLGRAAGGGSRWLQFWRVGGGERGSVGGRETLVSRRGGRCPGRLPGAWRGSSGD